MTSISFESESLTLLMYSVLCHVYFLLDIISETDKQNTKI